MRDKCPIFPDYKKKKRKEIHWNSGEFENSK